MPMPELIVVPIESEYLQHPEMLASLLRKAAFMCARSEPAGFPCQLSIVSVVYEPVVSWILHAAKGRDQLKAALLAHTQSQLDTAVANALVGTNIDRERVTTTVVWGERAWRTVLDHADAQCADMIVWSEGLSRWRRAGKAPEEWQLARHSGIPILFSQSPAWHEPTALVVAVDAFSHAHDGLNAVLLEQAKTLAALLAGHIYVVSCLPVVRPPALELGLLQEYVAQADLLAAEGRKRLEKALGEAGIANAAIDVSASDPVQKIAEVTERIGPAAVVLGTHARSGVGAAALGNTCEKLIYGLSSDVFVVPKS